VTDHDPGSDDEPDDENPEFDAFEELTKRLVEAKPRSDGWVVVVDWARLAEADVLWQAWQDAHLAEATALDPKTDIRKDVGRFEGGDQCRYLIRRA
jgi:hypothetical protein